MEGSNKRGDPRAPRKRADKHGWSRIVAKVKRQLDESKTRKKEENTADRAARLTANATHAIAWLTGVLAIVAALTLIEIVSGGVDTESLVDASKKQARASQIFASTAGKINGNMTSAVNKLDAQAKNSAASIKTTQEAMRLEQRAWVFATGFHLSAEPESGQPITVTFYILNNGKTPALNVLPMSHPSNRPIDPPEVSDWDLVARGTRKRGLLPPGITGLSVTTSPLTLVNALEQYKSGVNSIYMQAKITYLDTFQKPHWTSVCVLHRYGRPLGEFDFCEQGNDVDKDSKNHPKAN